MNELSKWRQEAIAAAKARLIGLINSPAIGEAIKCVELIERLQSPQRHWIPAGLESGAAVSTRYGVDD